MRKILLTTVILIVSMCKGIYAQTNEWIDLSPDVMQGYTINGFSFYGAPMSGSYGQLENTFETYSSAFVYGEKDEDGSGMLGYTTDGGGSWNLADLEIGALRDFNITRTIPVTYTLVGDNNTVVFSFVAATSGGGITGWQKAQMPDGIEDIDFVSGAFASASLMGSSGYNLPLGVLTDGNTLYTYYLEPQGPNPAIARLFPLQTEEPVEEITKVIYGGYNSSTSIYTFYAVGKGGQIFRAEIMTRAGIDYMKGIIWELVASASNVDFVNVTFLDGNNSIMLLSGVHPQDPDKTYLYTYRVGENTPEMALSFLDYGNFQEFTYLEREMAYYSLSDRGILMKFTDNFTISQRVENLLPETDVAIKGFTITERLVRYAVGEEGMVKAYVPETKVVIEVESTPGVTDMYTFRDKSEGYILSNDWEFENASGYGQTSNFIKMANVKFGLDGMSKVSLTVNGGLTVTGPTGEPVDDLTDFVEVSVSTDADWQLLRSTGGSGDQVSKIIFPEENPFTGFAAVTENNFGSMLKTTDAGQTWNEVLNYNSGILALSFPTLQVGYAGSAYLYQPNPGMYLAPKVWKTTDEGNNWEELNLSDFEERLSGERTMYSVEDIYFWTEDEGIVVFTYYTSSSIVLYTKDGGETWTESAFVPIEGDPEGTSYFINKLSFVDENNIYAIGSNQRLFKTENGGETWSLVSSLTEYVGQPYVLLNAVAFRDAEYGIVVTNDYPSRLLITEDGGDNWETYETEVSYMRAVHFIDNESVLIGGDNDAIMKSEDGGKNWEAENSFALGASHYSFASTATGVLYASGSYASIKRYAPELNVSFEAVINSDSTFIELVNRTVGLVTEYTWEINGEVVSNDFNYSFVTEKPNVYTIVLTGSNSMESDTFTKEIELVIPGYLMPQASINPTPADGEQLEIFSDVELSWENNSTTEHGQLKFNIYRGTSQDVMTKIAEDITEMTYTISKDDLEGNTTYYWRVDTKNDYATQPGSVWSFTTTENPGGISDNTDTTGFSIYPNPFADSFVIRLGNQEAARKVEVTLSDLQGRTVYSNIVGATGDITVEGLAELASGIYVCTVKINGITSVQKVVKQ